MNSLTAVMYHYVRPLEHSRYPRIRGRRLAEFRSQLDHLMARYRLVGVEDVLAAVRGEHRLPPDAALLTFDDGFADHYAHVFPLLADRGVQGAFFPPARAVLDRVLLDVHRIHFVLASAPDPEVLRRAVDEELDEPGDWWQRYGRASRFDPAEVVYVKRLLQVGLPRAVRSRIAARLFARFVSVDETAFAEELYLSLDQLRLMRSCGMEVGGHGDAHDWLGSLTADDQRREVDRSLDLLRAVGVPDDGWTMAYPYGDWDARVLDLLAQRGCALGLTSEVRVADLDADPPLLLPRLDTNDLPH